MVFSRPPGRRQRLGLLLIISILMLSLTPPFQQATGFPRAVRMAVDSEVDLEFPWPDLIWIRTPDQGLKVDGRELPPGQWARASRSAFTLTSLTAGASTLEMRILGLLPFRRMEVVAVPRVEVVPGGHSIGILARAAGLVVIEQAPVAVSAGDKVWPAREAGIRPGDLLVAADGEKLEDPDGLARLVQRAGAQGRDLNLSLRRGGRELEVTLKPVRDQDTNRYLLGLWVRDGAAGVGTLTFWEPDSMIYAALGHEIVDPSSGRVLEIESGVIVEASVWGLERAQSGRPGEKIGVFDENSPVLGDIQVNASCGILGRLESEPEGPADKLVDIALADEVEPGPAKLLTVLQGSTIQAFDISIERVSGQASPGVKSLVIRVEDPELMETAGGIVQGMSGSPIIQNGRLVGAVTHVFLGDPGRGYGVFAEWMAVEAGALGITAVASSRGLAAMGSPTR